MAPSLLHRLSLCVAGLLALAHDLGVRFANGSMDGGKQIGVLGLAFDLMVPPGDLYFDLVCAVFVFKKHVSFGFAVRGIEQLSDFVEFLL